MNHALFSPLSLGSLTLPNRIIMAPLTRCRALQPGDIPWALNAEYYQQRASAGLIISEATQISPQGKGYAYTPGIYSEAQIQGWRKVTEAVHQAGGHIFAQLWHVGRISHPDIQPESQLPVAPSALRPAGEAFTETGFKPFVTPRALGLDEIPSIVDDYRQATANALEAGFDGVEIHAANGYLLDQFLRDGTNQRTDGYGGSIANRCRLLLEVIEAACQVYAADRIGVRLSPTNPFNDMTDSDPEAHFGYLVDQLNPLGLAYLHIVERMLPDDDTDFDFKALRARYQGVYMTNGGYTPESAASSVAAGHSDLVAFGKAYIANPDLVERVQLGAMLNEADPNTFYSGNEQGYTDYPSLTTG